MVDRVRHVCSQVKNIYLNNDNTSFLAAYGVLPYRQITLMKKLQDIRLAFISALFHKANLFHPSFSSQPAFKL